MPVASSYSAALDLVTRHGVSNSSLFEVNADGSIRTQNWKEKLGNFGARITRNYSLRKDTKDAAVAAALERMANDALNGPDEEVKHTIRFQEKYPADILVRFNEAKQRVEQRNAPRHATISAAPANPADQAGVASLHQQGATNAPSYGATAQTQTINAVATPPAAPAGTAAVDLTALANKYQVNHKIAKYLVSGPEFGKVIRAILSEPKTKGAQWGAPIDQKYATLLNKTYEQELAYAVAAGRDISDHQILQWAIAALKQSQ
jgi:hypothetical protein